MRKVFAVPRVGHSVDVSVLVGVKTNFGRSFTAKIRLARQVGRGIMTLADFLVTKWCVGRIVEPPELCSARSNDQIVPVLEDVRGGLFDNSDSW